MEVTVVLYGTGPQMLLYALQLLVRLANLRRADCLGAHHSCQIMVRNYVSKVHQIEFNRHQHENAIQVLGYELRQVNTAEPAADVRGDPVALKEASLRDGQ
mgnify:CR=1 FL=1